jgi:hypothetical protein
MGAQRTRSGLATRRGVTVLLVTGLLAAGAACGSSKRTETGGTGATTTTTAATSTQTTGPADGGIDPMDGADTATKTGSATGQGTALLTDLRVARQEGYDRVVFEFSDHVPGWQIGYITKPVHADGSGEEVPVEGNDVVGVRMEPASGVDLTATTAPKGYLETYAGPTRINVGTPEVTEVVRSGDFEAVLNWVIGTREKVNFRVLVLSSPARLVVVLQNH